MASRRGKVVHFIAPGTPLALVEQDVPDPAPGELLVRIDLAGICGTDVHRLSGDVRPPAEPVCFGHEGTGFVVAIGAGADRDRAGAHLALGDRVYWAPY